MMTLIEARSLTKRYGQRTVVSNVDLAIEEGRVTALIGPNGAGKSTTIAMLLGILKPDGGSVTYWREDYKGHIGVQLQTTPFFEGYTAEENLKLFAALYRVRLDRTQLREKLDACGIAPAGRTVAGKLSMGQQKRLAIAVTTVHQPTLIILDEPTAGLDPRGCREVRELIRSLREAHRSVLFTSHDMEAVERTADRVLLISGGRIAAQGAPAALLEMHQADSLEALYLKLTENKKGESC